jgi:Protein of unknown function (DUF3341)
MAHDVQPSGLYGLMAEFDSAQALLDATRQVTDAGYTKTDAFSPFPIHGLSDALKIKERKVAPMILAGALTGTIAGYGLEYWTQAVAYRMNIGGRPYHAWVSFIPPAFETTILFAAFSAVFGMLALNGLPHPYHPVFNAPRFARASQDKFFLVIEAKDPKFDRERTRAFLADLRPSEVVEVDE